MKSSTSDEMMSIGDIAGRFGLATHVLRHWEAVGLLAPRRQAGRRRYGPDELWRVAVILRAKEAGISLEDIRKMMADQDPVARRAILQRRQADLQRRIAEARTALDLIECALDCDHADFTQCARFQAMVYARIGGQPGGLRGEAVDGAHR